MHVLDGHVRLQRRDALHRAERASLLRGAAVDDARLVEMDMGLDEARADEMAGGIEACGIGREARRDHGDAAALDADVKGPVLRTVERAGIADAEVHGHSALMLADLISGRRFSLSGMWVAARGS